jgi:hypothetical protein
VSARRRPPAERAPSGALAEVARAADPALQPLTDPDPPAGGFEARFPAGSDRAFVVEAIHEGWLMHYDAPRLFKGADDDLRLLGGDAMYALGLARLAAGGDLEGIAELADLISLSARAAAEGRPELGLELWSASVEALAEDREVGAGGARTAFARLSSDDPGKGRR